MAFVSSFPCKPTSLALKSQLKSKSTLYPINTVTVTSNHINHFSKICITGYSMKNQRRIFKAQAVDGDSNKEVGEGVDETVGFEATKEPSEIDLLKKALFDSLNRTDSSDTRADIIELITQLEAKNPTPAPTQASTLLNGKWILAYASIPGLVPSMASESRPLVKIEQIFEIIHTENFTVQASVLFAGPFGTSTFSANGKLEVRGPKRLQVKFEEGIIESPQFKDSTELPDDVEIIGHKMNLSPVKGLITSLQDAASSVARTISSQPPMKFPITSDSAQFWLLTTYLDEELRISRADGGSVFVECISR